MAGGDRAVAGFSVVYRAVAGVDRTVAWVNREVTWFNRSRGVNGCGGQ